ncbi:MAG: hypothetical protein JWL81_1115 [Verrucomicrobiales bacterium]|nr:hypothetical protein [Verrucomicrobiales bacterium]
MSAPHPPQLSVSPPSDLALIVRRHAHDVRNHLNGLELNATLLGELVEDPDAAETVAQMRRILSQLEENIKSLLIRFDEPRPVMVAAGDLLQLWRMQVRRFEGSEHHLLWPDVQAGQSLEVDAKAVVSVLCELTLAAWKRGNGQPLQAGLNCTDGEVTVSLSEPGQRMPFPQDLASATGRFIALHGGLMKSGPDESGHFWVTSLTFSCGAS